MISRHADRGSELGLPGGKRLRRSRIDQVEGKPRKDASRKLNGVPRFGRIVDAPERLQRLVVERLHAEREAIDARRAIAAEALRLGTAGIGFERHLRFGRDRPETGDRIEHRFDGRRLHQRRRAATKEDRGDGAARRQSREVEKFLAKCRGEARLVGRLMPDMAVEIAIGALRRAEGPVDIDAEGRGAFRYRDKPAHDAGAESRSAKSRKARARCESGAPAPGFQPCFSSALISPKVRECPSGRKIGS